MTLYEERMKKLYPEKYTYMHINEKTMKWERDVILPPPPPPTKRSRRKTPPKMMEKVKARDGYKCAVCGSCNGLQIHHKIYRSNGGADTLENLVTLCEDCHMKEHEGEPIHNLMMARHTRS